MHSLTLYKQSVVLGKGGRKDKTRRSMQDQVSGRRDWIGESVETEERGGWWAVTRSRVQGGDNERRRKAMNVDASAAERYASDVRRAVA